MKDHLDSPADIEFLLWCHTSPSQHPCLDSGHHSALVIDLVECGAIEQDKTQPGFVYRTTPKGAAWIRALEKVPIPRQVFVDEAGRMLE